MGGQSSQQQTQQSISQPWAPAQGTLTGILGALNSQLPNVSNLNPTQQGAINSITQNALNAPNYGGAANNYISSLFGGGGALNQAPNIQANYGQYAANTSPLANNTNYNPYNTPGFSDALNTATQDITNNINGQFAAAGRDMSGANTQALSRGLSQGLGSLIQQQYNQNVQNQQNAAGNLYNAGNTNAGLLSGLQQQYLANQGAGLGGVQSAIDAGNAGATTALNAQTTGQQLPLQNLGLLANIGIPIAGLGGQTNGTSNTTTQLPWYAGIGQIGGLFSGGQNSAARGLLSFL